MSDQRTDYRALVDAGHSPASAGVIALDARRGDVYAVKWIADLRRTIPPANQDESRG